ncbi:ABC transporter permease [Nitrosomonas sp.]|uniref:ABC transporter permease n=1 Tax=Nitrosomonas sp. TaxID=42353 RepID=UPI0025E4D46A|nr:ABC transporter permease [Nitrosomonas sp.]MCC6917500.1 ABC transporter permease [Nitrosomonas sp.]
MTPALLTRWLLLGEWHSHRLQSIVAVLAIMLGVALGFTIHLINTAAVTEFSTATRSLSGTSDLTVRAVRTTFDESLYPALMHHTGVAQASPVLEITAGVPAKTKTMHNPVLTILGLDVFRAAAVTPDLIGVPAEDKRMDTLADDAVFLSPAAMEWFAVKQGDSIEVSTGAKQVKLRVAGGLTRVHAGQRIAVMDIGAAQWRFDQIGRLSRIELKLQQGVDHHAFRATLDKELGPSFLLTESEDDDIRARNMSRAYRVNLNILALVALFTGAFLIFSGQVLSTIRRRSQLALLRVLGMTRRQLLRQLLLESGSLGILGSLLGLALGYLLAATALHHLGADLGAGFFPGLEPRLHPDPLAALFYFLLGTGVTIAGSLLPAWEAAHTHPAPALKSGSEYTVLAALRAPRLAAVCLLAGILFSGLPPVNDLPVFGYLAVVLLLVGSMAALPYLCGLFFSALSHALNPGRSGVLTVLAVTRLSNASGLAAVALGGILVSFSLMVAMAIMVASFRISVDDWLTRVLPADLYLHSTIHQDMRGFIRDEQQAIAGIPAVERTDFIRSIPLTLDPARPNITLLARPIDENNPGLILPLTGVALSPGDIPPDTIPIWASEAMVDLYGYQTGMRVTLPFADPAQSFIVAGIWRDYGRMFGAVQMQLSDYRNLTGDDHISDAALWLKKGAVTDTVIASLKALPFGNTLEIMETGRVRAVALKQFDRSFAVTYLLELVAIGVGLMGVAASFSAQTLTRVREFGMLRHIGFSKRQIYRMLTLEGGLLSGFGIAAGFLLGTGISLILIFIINPQSFHWSMQLHMPWTWLLLMALAVLGAAATTAFSASRRAASGNVIRAVREDW